MLVALGLSVYVVVFAAAAAGDLIRYEIPNRLSLALAAAFLPFATALPPSIIAAHLLAALCMLVLAALGFGFGLMGGGDAKLLSAAALWMGWHDLVPFIVLTALAGACLGMVLLALRRLLPQARWAGRWYSRALSPEEGVPYGVAIAAAALALLPRLAAAPLQ
jgi:prepilin peptidase CpaA